MHRFLIIIFGLLYLGCFGQMKVQKILIDNNSNSKDCKCLTYNNKSDTTNNFIVFEEIFNNDTISIHNGDSILYRSIVSSNRIVGFADQVNIGDYNSNKVINISINNLPIIGLVQIHGKYYIRLRYSLKTKTLSICYSKFLPYYE